MHFCKTILLLVCMKTITYCKRLFRALITKQAQTFLYFICLFSICFGELPFKRVAIVLLITETDSAVHNYLTTVYINFILNTGISYNILHYSIITWAYLQFDESVCRRLRKDHTCTLSEGNLMNFSF